INFFYHLGTPSGWSNVGSDKLKYAQTYTLTLLIFLEIMIAITYCSTDFVNKIGFTSNKLFGFSIILVIISHISIIYTPIFNTLFHTTVLNPKSWITILVQTLIYFVFLEFLKFCKNRSINR
ncbi:MAG: cation transporting ATPase C-terminal domain-containing protein, partial [Candidatus Hodarchaeales archaeon]